MLKGAEILENSRKNRQRNAHSTDWLGYLLKQPLNRQGHEHR